MDPDAQLVQIFLTIEQYRKEPRRRANVLGIAPERLDQLLDLLRRLGLIQLGDGGGVTNAMMHLPSDSPVFRPYRSLLRQRAMQRQASLPDRTGYASYSVPCLRYCLNTPL